MNFARNLGLLMLSLLTFACVDELDFNKFDEVSPAPNVLLPALEVSVKLEDFLQGDSVLTQDPDGFLRFVYEEDSLFSMSATEFVSIPAQEPFALDNIPIIQDSTLTFTIDAALSSLGDMELEQIDFRRLAITWSISTPAQAPVSVQYTFNNASRNGMPLTVTGQSFGPGDFDGLQIFNDVSMDLTQSGNPAAPPYNNLSLTLSVTPDPSIPTGTPVTIGFGLDSTVIGTVSGYFGQRPVNLPNGNVNLNLGSISEFTSGFTLTDPRLKFIMNNGMGISMGLNMDLDGVNSDGAITALNPPPFNVAQPTVPGTSVVSEFELNNGNSNIVSFLDALPTNLIYSGGLRLNPNNTGQTPNFLSDQDKLSVGMEIDLPMELRTQDLRFSDEFEMALSDQEFIELLVLRFESVNGFPLDMTVKLSFLDSLGGVTDSVVMPILDAAEVDANGRAIQPVTNVLDVTLTERQINTLATAPSWRITGRVATPDLGQTAVRLYADYTLEISMSLKGRIRFAEL